MSVWPSSSGNKRQSPAGGAVLAAIAVALVAAVAIVLLQRSADEHRKAEVLVGRIETLASQMVALERLVERDLVMTPEVTDEVEGVSHEMAQRLADLEQLDGGSAASACCSWTWTTSSW